MAEKIHELLQEQKVMVNGISHDIRTPIARLRFALDLTRNCQTVEALRQHIQDMDMDLDELDQLIKDWLFYAGLTSTAKQITFDTRVEISSLLMEKTNSFAPMYPNIRVISAIEPLNVLGNQRLLSRCIENIL